MTAINMLNSKNVLVFGSVVRHSVSSEYCKRLAPSDLSDRLLRPKVPLPVLGPNPKPLFTKYPSARSKSEVPVLII